jgi:hypothetical protein
MPLPSSGTLGFNTIAASLPLYGTFNPYSLKKMAIITGVGGSWDAYGNWNNNEPYKVSEFYGYAGNGFKYGSPQILLDYALSGFYSSPTSVIKDTSGISIFDATFVTGTGNGTATNYTGYNSNIGTFNTNTTGQYAIRLPNYAKFSGNEAHTLICWFKVTDFSTSFPGLISCEGRSAGGQPIGYSLYLSQISATTFSLNYSRFSGTSGTQYNLNLALGSAPLTTNTWYMAAVTYDGSNIVLYLRYSDNTYAYTTGTNTYSIVADASWGCFQGLRYNNWLNGTFGYTAIYYGVLNVLDIFKIQQATRQRYV